MKVESNAVVSIEYVLRDDAGAVLDQSKGGEPLAYLHGHGNIVPGLEKALAGLEPGQSTKAEISPEDGYGAHDPGKTMRVARSQLPEQLQPEVGMMLHAEGPQGPMPLWITEVEAEAVTVDGNHPLAGKTLHFEVQIKDVREASPEELQHGHVHGPGGHHH